MFRIIQNSADTATKCEFGNAIVTICIGDDYFDIWNTMCRQSWQNYADRHGLDLIVVIDDLDPTERGRSRSPAWQKLLILDQPWAKSYKRIVWVNANTMMAKTAPNILELVPDPTMIGIILSGSQMSEAERHIYFERTYGVCVPVENARLSWQIYNKNSFNTVENIGNIPMLDSGVMVLSQQHHAKVLRSIYEKEQDSPLHEQPFVSLELFRLGLAHLISPRFNWSVHEVMVLNFRDRPTLDTAIGLLEHLKFILGNELNKAYFLHFVGSMTLLRLLFQMGIHLLEAEVGLPAAGTPAGLTQLLQDRGRQIQGFIQASTACTVTAGPFSGMQLVQDVSWGAGDVAAKLLGHYEAELHPLIEDLIAGGFEEIFNIGCAEGFYAVGLALRCKTARVFAFDSDAKAQSVCLANAAANQVAERMSVSGTCDPARLRAMTSTFAKRLLLVDCEGYEKVLIDPDQVPGLRTATLLIECHDFVDRSITDSLSSRLSPTHDLKIIVEGARDPNQSPVLRSFNSFDRWLALCEFRPETMHWLVASPKPD